MTSHQQVMLFTLMLENIKSWLWLVSVTENPECRRALEAENRVCRVQYLSFFVDRDPDGFSLALGFLTHPSLTLPWPPYSELSRTPCTPLPLATALKASSTELTSHVLWGSHRAQLGLGCLCSLSKQLTNLKVLSNSQSNRYKHPIDWKIYSVVFKL